MAGYLICVSYDSGIPIFARRIGDINAIPFPLAASLNGVSIFGKGNKVELISTLGGCSRVLWKDYKDRISLIFVGPNDSLTDIHHSKLLDNIFNAIVFHVGLEDILSFTNLDKLKKDCRKVYPIIDKYLYGLSPHDKTLYFGDITSCADVCLHSETQSQFQTQLDILLENVACTYGCILVNGIIMASSKDWWCLKGPEICLITFVSSQQSSTQYTDIPIYLPISSPKTPFRLIVSRTKMANIQLVILCGQEPDAGHIQIEIKKWKNAAKDLFSLFHDDERPPSFSSRLSTIDPFLLGFFIINTEKQRCSFSILHEGKNQIPDGSSFPYRLDVLRTFYRSIVGSIFDFNGLPVGVTTTQETKDKSSDHKVLESYWSSEYHKCHAVQILYYQLFVLYNAKVSMMTMRSISHKLLNELTKDKILKM